MATPSAVPSLQKHQNQSLPQHQQPSPQPPPPPPPPPNQSWSWTQSIATQAVVEGESFSIDLANYGSDPEGDTVTFSATGLPTGISLSGSVISGPSTAVGSYVIDIEATDSGSNSPTTSSFTLNVTAASATASPTTVLFDDAMQNGALFSSGGISSSELSSAGDPV